MQVPTKADVFRLMNVADNNRYFGTHVLHKLPNDAMRGFNANLEAKQAERDMALLDRFADGEHLD